MKWLDRNFPTQLPNWMFPNLLERLRGTPARLEDRIVHTPPKDLVMQIGDTWSVQENIGHLFDLEPLWSGRLDDLLQGAQKMRAADLTNQTTENANYNTHSITALLQSFRNAREALVEKLLGATEQQLHRSAIHPRLNQPMTIVDMMFFIAEHDDHHLSRISAILRECNKSIGFS